MANSVSLVVGFVKAYTVHVPFPAKTTPETILQIAIEILETQGENTLSMRNLAEALGIKAPSLYRHYADRAALETAIAAEGARQLLEQIQNATKRKTPLPAARAAAKTYLEFAAAHPALYDLMMRPQAATGNSQALWRHVLELIGNISGRSDDTSAAVAFWAYLHGFSSLERLGSFGQSGPQSGFELGLESLLRGFERSVENR
jgi:AcrR family transcriptional regulator